MAFENILNNIEAQFADVFWVTNGIAVYPSNYQGKKSDTDEYCILSVMPSSSDYYAYDAKKSTKGLVAVKIFVKAGEGNKRIMQISDKLDTLLQHEMYGTTELGTSYLTVEGLDPSNKALYSASYIIPFTHYGE